MCFTAKNVKQYQPIKSIFFRRALNEAVVVGFRNSAPKFVVILRWLRRHDNDVPIFRLLMSYKAGDGDIPRL